MTGNILQNVYIKLNRGFCFLLFIIATIWQGEEIGKETLEMEVDEKKDNGTTQVVCCSGEAWSEDAYSNVYHDCITTKLRDEENRVDPNNKRQEPQAY